MQSRLVGPIRDRVNRGIDTAIVVSVVYPKAKTVVLAGAVALALGLNVAAGTLNNVVIGRSTDKSTSPPERIQGSGLGAANIALSSMSLVVLKANTAAVNSSPSTSPALEVPGTGTANAAPSILSPAPANNSVTTDSIDGSFTRDAAVSPSALLDTQAGGALYTQDNIPGATGGTPAP